MSHVSAVGHTQWVWFTMPKLITVTTIDYTGRCSVAVSRDATVTLNHNYTIFGSQNAMRTRVNYSLYTYYNIENSVCFDNSWLKYFVFKILCVFNFRSRWQLQKIILQRVPELQYISQ